MQKIPRNNALYNTKIKSYPDGSYTMIFCDEHIFRDKFTEPHQSEIYIPTYEPLDNPDYCGYPRPDPNSPTYTNRRKKKHENSTDDNGDDNMLYIGALKRAKDKIFDLVMCNKWDYFFTGTFDDSRAGENTPDNLLRPVQDWLKNQTRRKNLAYILVAEYTPINHRIHFHGLINSALELADSGTVLCKGKSKPIKISTANKQHIPEIDRRTVYNIPAWSDRFGYTTAIPVSGNTVHLARYITKYITKDSEKIFGKFYWSSRNIIREPEITLLNTDCFGDIMQPEHYIKGCTFRLKYDCFFNDGKGDNYE